jgi:hypothetical protein
MENKDMLTQSQIIEMGWTKSMINKLLPEPILKENPRYRNSAPMKLWDKDVFESIMQKNAYTETPSELDGISAFKTVKIKGGHKTMSVGAGTGLEPVTFRV